jgi:hypothetical protein
MRRRLVEPLAFISSRATGAALFETVMSLVFHR